MKPILAALLLSLCLSAVRAAEVITLPVYEKVWEAALEANRSLPAKAATNPFSIPSLPTFTLKVNAFGKASVI